MDLVKVNKTSYLQYPVNRHMLYALFDKYAA